jgi:hypothetical protein
MLCYWCHLWSCGCHFSSLVPVKVLFSCEICCLLANRHVVETVAPSLLSPPLHTTWFSSALLNIVVKVLISCYQDIGTSGDHMGWV